MVMKSTHTLKVPCGKTVCADVDFAERITSVKITGDFFLHPEDAVLNIEKVFKGLDAKFDEQKAADAIEGVLRKGNAELIGLSASDVVRAVSSAIGGAR